MHALGSCSFDSSTWGGYRRVWRLTLCNGVFWHLHALGCVNKRMSKQFREDPSSSRGHWDRVLPAQDEVHENHPGKPPPAYVQPRAVRTSVMPKGVEHMMG